MVILNGTICFLFSLALICMIKLSTYVVLILGQLHHMVDSSYSMNVSAELNQSCEEARLLENETWILVTNLKVPKLITTLHYHPWEQMY